MELPNLATSKVLTGQLMSEFVGYKTILNSLECDDWLRRRTDLIGWTYSFTPMSLQLCKFVRLIAAKCNGDLKYTGIKTEIKYAINVHAKCYISKYQALVGSFNLTAPTIEDIGVVINDKRHVAHLRKEFNRQWKLLT